MTKEQLFEMGNIPLYDANRKIALMWSAKAGCTTAIKWFFNLMGFLDMGLYYHPWIHVFRNQVYYKSRNFEKNILDILNGEYVLIKVVRNPYTRAVSSYVHAMKHKHEHKRIPRSLAIRKPQDSYTFREFVKHLKVSGVESCEQHHRQQIHPLELMGLVEIDHLVKVENFEEDLRKVERELGIPPCDFSKLNTSSHHTKRIHDPLGECVADKRFSIDKKARGVELPAYEMFYTQDIANDVYTVYQKDFEAYNYPRSIALPGS